MSEINKYTDPPTDVAIMLENVSVQYRIPNEKIATFKEYMIRLVQGKIKHNSFFALKDITLDIKQGEIFGILGRNGAGKSTLLQVISRVLIPSQGRIWVKGTVNPLLQLGAGFHVELTGRENIYLNATLLGHSRKDIDEKLDEIMDFAEIGEFIEAPIRTYSSGMKARLGFAIATAWQPDILILDEVLSVGDIAFRKKCVERMTSFQGSGATVVMVSHSVNQIREISQRVMWLDRGIIKALGESDEVCDAYNKTLQR